jgi:hypothetical protein
MDSVVMYELGLRSPGIYWVGVCRLNVPQVDMQTTEVSSTVQ